MPRATALLPVLAGTGCAGPLSTLSPAGPAAGAIADLWWIMLAGSAAILALVGGLLAAAFVRRGRRPASARLWLVGGGIAFPVTVLAALLAAAMVLGERTVPAAPDALTVTAEASQYRWRFGYPGIVTAESEGVLHIPAGRPVTVAITTADVIHSFWVPRLGGKMDAIPGHVNRLRIEASQPGEYLGICAEYCGPGHARHGFRVIAHPPAGWAAFAEGGAR